MQGTIVMMMALSGLGCHHKSSHGFFAAKACYSAPVVSSCYNACYDVGYAAAPACYSTACYSTACYSSACYSAACYSTACYDSACYSSACYSTACYSSACYSGTGHGLRHKLGGLFGRHKGKRGGLFHHKAAAGCYSAAAGCYSGCYGVSAPVFGSYTPVYASAPIVSSQLPTVSEWGPVVPSKQGWVAPESQVQSEGQAAPASAPANNNVPSDLPEAAPRANDSGPFTPPPAVEENLPSAPGELNTPPPPAPEPDSGF